MTIKSFGLGSNFRIVQIGLFNNAWFITPLKVKRRHGGAWVLIFSGRQKNQANKSDRENMGENCIHCRMKILLVGVYIQVSMMGAKTRI
jgi:hypothetical protein